MNLILLTPEDFTTPHQVRLFGRRHEHICKILQATQGQQLRVGLLGGKTGHGKVLDLSESKIDLQVTLDCEPPAPHTATLILALPRPKTCRRILQSVTAMGVKRIILLNSWRVDKSYWQSPLLEEKALREQLILGLEQACDTILPEIELRQRFKPFVEDELPQLAVESYALVAHHVGGKPCPTNCTKPMTLAIGPEGGFLSYEIDKLTEAGLTSIHLGHRPLRVETAVSALLGRLLPY